MPQCQLLPVHYCQVLDCNLHPADVAKYCWPLRSLSALLSLQTSHLCLLGVQPVYGCLEQWACEGGSDASLLHVEWPFALHLLQLLESEDPRERIQLRGILQKMLTTFQDQRSAIFTSIRHTLHRFSHAQESCYSNGVADLLTILCDILRSFDVQVADHVRCPSCLPVVQHEAPALAEICYAGWHHVHAPTCKGKAVAAVPLSKFRNARASLRRSAASREQDHS